MKYYDENFAEADYYFSQIHERHPNSPLAEQAVELGIISKHLSTGGSDYDGRKAAEARILVNSALNNYPGLASEKQQFLMDQLKNISYQQAEKDFKMAEFWARTGHPGSAFFYFELVLRRYPGTKFAELATVRRDQLRAAAEKEESKRSAKVMKPKRGLIHRINSSDRREMCVITRAAAAVNSIAKSRSDTASSELAQIPSKPRSCATDARSIG